MERPDAGMTDPLAKMESQVKELMEKIMRLEEENKRLSLLVDRAREMVAKAHGTVFDELKPIEIVQNRW